MVSIDIHAFLQSLLRGVSSLGFTSQTLGLPLLHHTSTKNSPWQLYRWNNEYSLDKDILFPLYKVGEGGQYGRVEKLHKQFILMHKIRYPGEVNSL